MGRLTVVRDNEAQMKASRGVPAARATLERRLSRMKTAFALSVFSLQGLSGVNRLHGHGVGDALIDGLGAALVDAAPRGALVARLSGAKFAVLAEARDTVAAEDFVDTLRARVDSVAIGEVILEVRAGLCWCAGGQGGGAQVEEAISSSLASIDRVAAGVAPQTYIIDPTETKNDMAAARRALGAIRAGECGIALQPVVDAGGSGRFLFREALIRVTGPKGETVTAGEFMPMLNSLGMTEDVDIAALRLVFEELRSDPSLRLSVNLSAAGLSGRRWLSAFDDLASRSPDCAERLIVEVTEEAALMDAGASTGTFALIRARGAAIALDDFGAGRTSFRQLRDFRFDLVKIDGGFIKGIDENPDNQMLVSALVGIARQFDMMVVAEFVETAAEARKLRALGVDGFQGFLFGRPALVWSNENEAANADAS